MTKELAYRRSIPYVEEREAQGKRCVVALRLVMRMVAIISCLGNKTFHQSWSMGQHVGSMFTL